MSETKCAVPRVQWALRMIDGDDAVDRLIAWHRLAKAGLAVARGVDHYLRFELNDTGRRLKADLPRAP